MKMIFQSIIENLILFLFGIFLHNALLAKFGSIKSRKIYLQNFPPETSRNFHEETILGKVGDEIRLGAKNANYFISTQK